MMSPEAVRNWVSVSIMVAPSKMAAKFTGSEEAVTVLKAGAPLSRS